MTASATPTPIRLVIFDKDGTLLDYSLTWDRAVDDLLAWVTNAEAFPDKWRGAADAVGFDLETRAAVAGSPLIAETGDVVAGLLLPWCEPTRVANRDDLASRFSQKGLEYATPMPGAQALLEALADRGVMTAIATNDDQGAAASTVTALGWTHLIGWVVGADSGYGAKPDPGMVHAVLAHYGATPQEAIMVGDTGHDIKAARSAAVRSVLLAPNGENSGGADEVIGHLGELLALIEP